jgi:hypothetical protein
MSAAALLTLFLAAQTPAEATPQASAPAAGVLGDRVIPLADYQDFLWQRFGRRGLAEYADLLRLRDACEQLDLPFDEAAQDREVELRVATLRRDLDQTAFAAELARSLEDPDSLRATLRLEVERLQRVDALVLATRVATDRVLHALFEQRHGTDGVRTEVAHVLVMPQFLRAERIRAGTPAAEIDAEELREEARRLAEACLAALDAGRPFTEVVAESSHDRVTREQGGRLPAWRPGLYGSGFGTAVESLEPGEYSRVVESGAGFHVVTVLSRERTAFADVRAALAAQYMASEPSWQEREEMLAALRAKTPLRVAPGQDDPPR